MEAFTLRTGELKKELGGEHSKSFCGFHGTRQANLEGISKNGLLKVGNPKNPSKAVDAGYFGNPRQGVYLSRCINLFFFFESKNVDWNTDIEYTLKYSNQLAPLEPGEKAKIIQFKVFPGKSCHIPAKNPGMGPTKGYHSHSSPLFLEWYLFDERQCYPEYVSFLIIWSCWLNSLTWEILEVVAFENSRIVADDEWFHFFSMHISYLIFTFSIIYSNTTPG